VVLVSGVFTGTRRLVIENITLEGIWDRQSARQEVAGARLMNLNNGAGGGDRTLLLHGVRGRYGVEMGLTAQNWEMIEADRCEVEYNTRDCVNLNGMAVRITHCRARYGGDDCFACYIPSVVPSPRSADQYVRSLLIADCDAYQTHGIKVAAPRARITGNTLRDCKHYGIRVFADEGGEGAASPDDVTITRNDIFDLIAAGQAGDGGGEINAGVEVSAYQRAVMRLTVHGNRVINTRGALWGGANYAMPFPEGLYTKTGFLANWPVQTAANEPSYQQQRGFRLITTPPPLSGEPGWRLAQNLGSNLRASASWEQALVIFRSAGSNWAVPAAETVWSGFAGIKYNFVQRWGDFRPTKMWIVPTISALGVPGTKLKIGYSTTQGGAYTAICEVTLNATGTAWGGGYASIPGPARAAGGMWLKILGSDGDGAANTTITEVQVWLAVDGDLPNSEYGTI
jgi:hypothetical protein